MTNKQIAQKLHELALLMQLHKHDIFKINAINNAATIIQNYPKEIKTLANEIINQIKGIGKSIAKKIDELINTGTIKESDDLLTKTPIELFELLEIKGLGIKTVIKLWQNHNITSIKSLKDYIITAKNNNANNLFSTQKSNTILEEINFYEKNKSKLLYPEALLIASTLKNKISNSFINSKSIIVGEIIRKCDIINKIEILTTGINKNQLKIFLDETFKITNTTIKENLEDIRFNFILGNINCIVYLLKDKSNFTINTFIHTGSEKFVNYILKRLPKDINSADITSEQQIFSQSKLDYIPPAAREDVYFNIIDNFPENIDISRLITKSDIKGLLHNHSNYSDGKNSILEMAQECKNMGYKYFGLCDHSKSAFYASGLSEKAILSQHKEIDDLNISLYPFKILKGIEVDILPDGSLDYDDNILKTFDFIVASVHSGLNMDIKAATYRIIKAINNKYVNIIAHPSSRLLLKRKGYELDYEKIFAACVKNNVSIELNANPKRLDLDWRLIYKATQMGVIISINPDAHNIAGLSNITYGLNMAEKGLLSKSFCLNAMPLDLLLKFFKKDRLND